MYPAVIAAIAPGSLSRTSTCASRLSPDSRWNSARQLSLPQPSAQGPLSSRVISAPAGTSSTAMATARGLDGGLLTPRVTVTVSPAFIRVADACSRPAPGSISVGSSALTSNLSRRKAADATSNASPAAMSSSLTPLSARPSRANGNVTSVIAALSIIGAFPPDSRLFSTLWLLGISPLLRLSAPASSGRSPERPRGLRHPARSCRLGSSR